MVCPKGFGKCCNLGSHEIVKKLLITFLLTSIKKIVTGANLTLRSPLHEFINILFYNTFSIKNWVVGGK